MTTRTDQPAGDQFFTETMAQRTSRLQQKSKPGRPRKQKLQENGVMSPGIQFTYSYIVALEKTSV